MTGLGSWDQRGDIVAVRVGKMEGLTGEMLTRHYKIAVRRSPRYNVYCGGYNTVYS